MEGTIIVTIYGWGCTVNFWCRCLGVYQNRVSNFIRRTLGSGGQVAGSRGRRRWRAECSWARAAEQRRRIGGPLKGKVPRGALRANLHRNSPLICLDSNRKKSQGPACVLFGMRLRFVPRRVLSSDLSTDKARALEKMRARVSGDG